MFSVVLVRWSGLCTPLKQLRFVLAESCVSFSFYHLYVLTLHISWIFHFVLSSSQCVQLLLFGFKPVRLKPTCLRFVSFVFSAHKYLRASETSSCYSGHICMFKISPNHNKNETRARWQVLFVIINPQLSGLPSDFLAPVESTAHADFYFLI